jgi:putative mRNA 3-end processing factor
MNEVLRNAGVELREAHYVDDDVKWDDLKGSLIIAPGSAFGSPWMKRFKSYSTAAASGWMALRGRRRWQSVDRGFVLSDHADWNGLNETIKATGCERVIVTHGYTDIFAKWLRTQGYDAITEKTMFGEEEGEE